MRFIHYSRTFLYIIILLLLPFIEFQSLYESTLNSKYFTFFFATQLLFFSYIFFHKNKSCIQINKLEIGLLGFVFIAVFHLLGTNGKLHTINGAFFIVSVQLFYCIKVELELNKSFIRTSLLLLLLSGLLQSGIGMLQYFDFIPLGFSYTKINGTFPNSGHLANYLATIFPIAIYIFLYDNLEGFSKYHKKLAIGLIFILFIIIPLTENRSGLISCILILLLSLYDNLNKEVSFSFLKKKLMGISIIVISIIVLFFLYQKKIDSSNGRLFIWKTSIALVKEKPFWGNGFDRFSKVYNEVQGAYFQNKSYSEAEFYTADIITHAYNEIYEFVINYGIIILIPIFYIFYILFASSNNRQQNLSRNCLVALFSIALFFYPTSIISIRLNLLLFLAIFSSTINQTKFNFIIPDIKYINATRTVFMVILNVGVIYHCIHLLLINKKLLVGVYGEKQFKTNKVEEMNKYEMNSVDFLLQQADFQVKESALKESNYFLEKAATLSTDPIIYYKIAENYSKLNRNDSAEYFYRKSINIIPNRLYPRFLLLKHYIRKRAYPKAEELCKQILEIKPKVNSDATIFIRGFAEKYLNDFSH